jgi:hypothetical protein
MKKMLLASVAIIAMGVSPAFAQIIKNNTDAGAAVGASSGGVAGAVAGGLIFGPIGAIIGGFAGATIGAEAGVEATDIDYVRLNPTEPVVIEGDIDVGYTVPETVTIANIEGRDNIGYFYTEDRVYFVDLSNRAVIYSPGTVVAGQ